jgi:hypothetical protein
MCCHRATKLAGARVSFTHRSVRHPAVLVIPLYLYQIRTNSRDFRAYVLTALSDLYAKFTLFLPIFGGTNDTHNYDFRDA